MTSTEIIHERAKSNPSLSYADIAAHVETLASLSKAELRAVALSVCVHSTASATKAWLLAQIRISLENRKGRTERTIAVA